MDELNEMKTTATQEASPSLKAWTAPIMTVATLPEITESGTGGTYTDGSSIYATS